MELLDLRKQLEDVDKKMASLFEQRMEIIENVRKKDEEIKKNSEIKKALQQIGFDNGGDDDE